MGVGRGVGHKEVRELWDGEGEMVGVLGMDGNLGENKLIHLAQGLHCVSVLHVIPIENAKYSWHKAQGASSAHSREYNTNDTPEWSSEEGLYCAGLLILYFIQGIIT